MSSWIKLILCTFGYGLLVPFMVVGYIVAMPYWAFRAGAILAQLHLTKEPDGTFEWRVPMPSLEPTNDD